MRNSKRTRDFFKKNFNPEAARQMSEFCREAHIIYDLWDNGRGKSELFDYLVGDIGCSEQDAEVICRFYRPARPPAELCPLETIERGNYKEVFELLSLQLPSINNNKREGVWPKNLLAWWMMRKVYGEDSFSFELHGTGLTFDNKILFSRLINGSDGNPLPFGLAALNAIRVGELPAHAVKKAEILISKLDQVGMDFAKILLEADFIFPPNKTLQQLIEVIKRGLEGESVVLSGAFCPDYSYRESSQPGVKYEYTFKSVDGGIGLVAQQFVRVLPALVKFFDQYGIKYRVKLGIGDFEANSPEILHSVGLSRDEFIARCMMSLEAFRQALPDIPMKLALFEQHWANGRWSKYIDEARIAMSEGNFGRIKPNTGKEPRHEIAFIAKDSASFYRRWYDRSDMEDEEITRLVINQGAEYVAMGRVLADDFGDQPFIQIAGDRPKMQMFNAFASNHPTLCCKRVY